MFAKPALPMSAENVVQDYALLKVSAVSALPFLDLGSPSDIAIGGDAMIIGLPFSAILNKGETIKPFLSKGQFRCFSTIR